MMSVSLFSQRHDELSLSENSEDCAINGNNLPVNAKKDSVIDRFKNEIENGDLTSFSCNDLDEEEEDEESNTQTTKKIPHKCIFCLQTFNLRAKLRNHMAIHVPTPHNCPVCQCQFPNPSSLRDHLVTHCTDAPFSCYVCAKGFSDEPALIKHMLSHRTERNYKCTKCDRSFKYVYSLETHKCHQRVAALKCDVCGQQFREPVRLAEHQATHYGAHFNYTPAKRETKEYATVLYGPNGRRRHQCTICEKFFTQSSSLNVHMKGHTGIKPYRCEFCQKGFHIADHYTRHRRSKKNH